MPPRLTLAVAFVLGGAVSCGTCSGTLGNDPPVAPLPRHLPDAAFASYPHSDAGLPILMSSSADELDLDLVYDETLDDPIAHWGQCLDRVTSCFAANQGRLGACVDLIEVCDAGTSEGCCPQACIDDYKDKRRTLDEWNAVKASFLEGTCIDGLKDQLSILYEPDVQP